MGNGLGKLTVCFTGHGGPCRKQQEISFLITEPPLDEGLGQSFCYVRPDPTRLSSSKVHSEEETTTTTFRTISGASVSANTLTPLSTDLYSYGSIDRATTTFESSTSFASLPLQPIPRNLGLIPGSGPLERGFMSGPIERGFMSGPIDRGQLFSGPIGASSDQFQRSFSHGGFALRPRTRKGRRWMKVLQRAISKTLSRRGQNSIVAPISGIKEPEWIIGPERRNEKNLTGSSGSVNFSSDGSLVEDDDSTMESQNLQWAQGKAGEDRVHVVVSEEHGWVFVGIYDGFNGPDAPDYLLSNLYASVHKELKGLLWDDGFESSAVAAAASSGHPTENSILESEDIAKERTRVELDRRLKEQLDRSSASSSGNNSSSAINHYDVLHALSEALRKTEESYLEFVDRMVMENPELALMGSCVLVMLMKGEDVYVMNVGDSRVVLSQKAEPDYWLGKIRQDLERINEETMHDLESLDGDRSNLVPSLSAIQLSKDHSTNIEDEVERIKKEHPDDACAVQNDRVKGSLKVTRAFGAAYLKQPKWNNALLEMFRIDYVGTSPYITCLPYLKHHRLGPKDKFLILSSDGLYQYLTNEEAVAEVELFITLQPEGDPAQHLIEEVLFRAAKKAGMDFHELLDIPQGDRRRYHDDISIIVISLEGRIWRSCV
ncbi:putative protein phosphatase 2C 23 [Senna tora]|uniref:protein-serine/threonine phosphatase n=1 Tax=Senna tora TaxID=362788 RepID=A0A834WHJ4_9FABA|nr:putative protein phosphatase 2C 23 [Senna tora]